MFSNKWYQLFVKAPPGNGYTNSQAMGRIDAHLTSQTAASFTVSPNE